jgi:hypothetical protein
MSITITVEGGVIQSIDGIPPGQKVVVMDFDTDGTPADELKENEQGEKYAESVHVGEYAPEPPAGTMRYFEFYIPSGGDSGSSCGFKTDKPGLGSPDKLDKDKIIELFELDGYGDASDVTTIEEIGAEEYEWGYGKGDK